MRTASRPFQALVIGGGINGLSTVAALQRLGLRRVVLVERFEVGHGHGSSHGHSRITRSVYADANLVNFVQVAHREDWPRLEREVGRRLIEPCPGCFYGPGDRFEQYAAAVAGIGDVVKRVDPVEARRLFPAFRFRHAAAVLVDRSSGVVAAEQAIAALAKLIRERGAEIRDATQVTAIDASGDPIRVDGSNGPLYTERLIVTAGAWTGRLFPELRQRLTVIRQTVAYVELGGERAHRQLGAFPVWVYLGDEVNDVFYGLPEFERPGVKVGRHRTSGGADDPDDLSPAIAPEAVEDLRRFCNAHFTMPVTEVLHVENCLYTTTATEDFIIAAQPKDARIVVGSACSGHGFKFGPLTGRLLADLAVNGAIELPEFAPLARRFAWPT